jgi:transposase-like protein
MRIPQNALSHSMKQLFGLPLSRGAINQLKATVSHRYQATYRAILDRIVVGKLVHVDETKAKIDRKEGYVWAFTNLEEVALFSLAHFRTSL